MHQFLEEGQGQHGPEFSPGRGHRVGGKAGDQKLKAQPQLAGKAGSGAFRDLQVVVVKADEPVGKRDREHDPHIWVVRIGPQDRGDEEPDQDHQPAHGRRALFGQQVRLRPVLADGLALALPGAQGVDEPRPEDEHHEHGRYHRTAGAEGDVAEQVENLRLPAENT